MNLQLVNPKRPKSIEKYRKTGEEDLKRNDSKRGPKDGQKRANIECGNVQFVLMNTT